MSYSVFLGLDFGTSGARACAIAENGEIEDFARLDFGRLDGHEQAPAWRNALFELIAGLPAGLRRRLADIALDGTSATVLACDPDLAPSHDPIPYNDARARAEAERIGRAGGPEHAAATATSGLAKALWLRPRLAAGKSHLILNQADWLAALLTGRPGVSDYHNALKLGYEPGATAWPHWLEALWTEAPQRPSPAGMAPCHLPRVIAPGAPLGPLERRHALALGLPDRCRVRAGTTDSIAAFLATGAGQPGDAVTSLGSTLVLKLVSSRRIDAARLGVYSHWFGDRWLAGGASNAGGAVLRAHFSDAELSELSARIDPNGASGLDYYPLVAPGERFPVCDPDLPPRLEPRPPEPARFLHGLLEGLAGIEALGYRLLAELGAEPPTRILSTGGGAGNPVYSRIRERRLGLPVVAAQQQEAAYGAARLARTGTALFPGSTP